MLLALWRGLLAVTMVAMVLSVGLGVITRYVLAAPLFWTEEVARYSLVAMTFLGMAELFRLKAGHIKVEILVNAVSRPWQRVLRGISDLVVAATLVVMIVGGALFVDATSFARSAALGLPMGLFYGFLPACGLIGLGFLLYRRVRPLPEEDQPPWKS